MDKPVRITWNGYEVTFSPLSPPDGVEKDGVPFIIHGRTLYDKRQIVVYKSRGQKERLDTLIHEGLHAIDPAATEKSVTTRANKLADLLWKAGYRRKTS